MNLNNLYNQEDFLIFLREFLPNFSKDIRKITLPKANRNILNARLLGTSADLDLSVFEIEHAGSIEKRVSLAQDGFRIMKESATYRALAVFYCSESSNWRFSLMTMSPSAKETGRIQVEYSNPRRYSFLLGTDAKIKTPHDYLQKRGVVKDFEDLQLRFSVDVVTKEFFKELSNWYFWAIDNVKFPKDAETEENGRNVAVIRLITRMIFIWFMRERGLVPKRLFEKVSMDIVLKNLDPEDSNYYKAILQNLFFATLSTKQEERQFREEKRYNKGWNKDFGNQYVYRYHDLFANPEEIKDYFNDIPFLNGGLFECLDDGKGDTYIDGFTERGKEYQPAVPNLLFFSEERVVDLNAAYGTKGKIYKVRGLFNILSSFNFTIDENSTDDQDIALDPELLGRVFENLLASFNPETSTTARKATGSFYTRREIVDYMVVESLKAYFKTHLSKLKNIDDKLNNLFSVAVEENPFSKAESKKIVALIEGIRIVDPAVGSGAFPMGALNKMVFILNKVDPRNELWKQAQIEATEAIPDPQVRRVTEKQIEEFFKDKNADYGRKLYLIQKCIYGVDIQQIAVEIAKLRFFISLLVDEKIDKASYNWGVQPLPNLDFKIMCGNSLQSVETQDLFGGHRKQELEKLKERLFFEPNKDKKKKIKIEIDKLFNELTNNRSIFDFALYFSEVFREKSGFDVVMANPPYIGEKGQKALFHEIKKYKLGRFYLGKMDYFYFFFHLALDLCKEDAQIAFITTNYYPTALGARKLRQDFKQRAIIRNLINFNELKIFEAALGQHNMITILQKGQDENVIAKTAITQRQGLAKPEILQQILSGGDPETSYYKIKQKDLYDGEECYLRLSGNSRVSENPVQKILGRIKTQGELLGVVCNVNNGIFAGADTLNEGKKKKYKITNANVGDGIFVLNKEEVDSLNLNDSEKSIIKPLFKNSDIYRYFTNNKNDLFIINLRYTDRPNIDDYPNIKSHLTKFKALLSDRPRTGTLESAFNNGYWYVMSTSRRVNMDSAKIVAPQRSPTNTFGYNEIPWYAMSDIFLITEKDKSIFLKYILALINSKLYYLWLYHRGKRKGEVLELIGNPLSEIPIKKISKDEQKPFIALVDKILAITSKSDYDPKNPPEEQKKLEKQIDQLVYKLYGLTLEEIKIIENTK